MQLGLDATDETVVGWLTICVVVVIYGYRLKAFQTGLSDLGFPGSMLCCLFLYVVWWQPHGDRWRIAVSAHAPTILSSPCDKPDAISQIDPSRAYSMSAVLWSSLSLLAFPSGFSRPLTSSSSTFAKTAAGSRLTSSAQGPLKRVGCPKPKGVWEAPITTLHW